MFAVEELQLFRRALNLASVCNQVAFCAGMLLVSSLQLA